MRFWVVVCFVICDSRIGVDGFSLSCYEDAIKESGGKESEHGEEERGENGGS